MEVINDIKVSKQVIAMATPAAEGQFDPNITMASDIGYPGLGY